MARRRLSGLPWVTHFCFHPWCPDGRAGGEKFVWAAMGDSLLFPPMVSGWAGGWREEVCPGYISVTIRCRKLILGRNIG